MRAAQSGSAAEPTGGAVLVSNPTRRSFWMIAKLSSTVIMNLIANLPFLYHKPENRGDLH
jgi:hypothetical protein